MSSCKNSIASPIDTGILLDAGTNELEVLVIRVGTEFYGVNVAKVREVLKLGAVTSLVESHAALEGVVRIRDQVVELVNLAIALHGEEGRGMCAGEDRLLVLEFNERLIAFRVQDVERIYRISWQKVQRMPVVGGRHVPVVAIVELAGRLVQILDFETLGAKLGMIVAPTCAVGEVRASVDRSEWPIVLAEDSELIRQMLSDSLREHGFQNLKPFGDGDEAWQFLDAEAQRAGDRPLRDHVAAVISDIEMPRMDGLHLTLRIRQHPRLKQVPVILFSSIVSKDNEKKGRQVGADAQVTKPRYRELAETLVRVWDERGMA